MERLRYIITLADLLFLLSLVSFWWTAALLLLLYKAFSVFPVNSTSSAENGRRNISKTSTNISLNFLLHFWIPLSRLPRTSVLHFRTVPPGPFLAPSLTLRFWHWESRDTPEFPGFISGSLHTLIQCINSKATQLKHKSKHCHRIRTHKIGKFNTLRSSVLSYYSR